MCLHGVTTKTVVSLCDFTLTYRTGISSSPPREARGIDWHCTSRKYSLHAKFTIFTVRVNQCNCHSVKMDFRITISTKRAQSVAKVCVAFVFDLPVIPYIIPSGLPVSYKLVHY